MASRLPDFPTLRITSESIAGHTTKVELDGVDISNWCYGLTFNCNVEHANQLTLHLHVREVEIDGQAIVRFTGPDDDARALLARHGWTPPADPVSPDPAAG